MSQSGSFDLDVRAHRHRMFLRSQAILDMEKFSKVLRICERTGIVLMRSLIELLNSQYYHKQTPLFLPYFVKRH